MSSATQKKSPLRKWLWPKSTQVRVGLVLTTLAIGTALFGPLFTPYAPTELVGLAYGKPSAEAWLGYDLLGRDVLSRLLAGGQSVVWMSICASAIALVIGSSLGILAALVRRKTDRSAVFINTVA